MVKHLAGVLSPCELGTGLRGRIEVEEGDDVRSRYDI
jgi:hypothetical protein